MVTNSPAVERLYAQNIGEGYLLDAIHCDRNRAFGFDLRAVRGLGDRNGLIATDFGPRLSSPPEMRAKP